MVSIAAPSTMAAKQAQAVDRMVEEVEGEDDRDYEPEIESKKIR